MIPLQWKYLVIESEGSYGLELRRYKGTQPLKTVPDFSEDRLFVENLALLFTEEQLEPEHMLDVISDFLALDSQ